MKVIEHIEKVATEEARIRVMAIFEELSDLPGDDRLDLTNQQLKVIYDQLYSACHDTVLKIVKERINSGSKTI